MLRKHPSLSAFFTGMAVMVLSLAPSWGQEAAPDAGQLLKRVRQAATLQENKDVKGQIRKRSVKVPFSMSLRGNLIVFQYQQGGVWNRFDLKFKDRGQEILSWKDGRAGVLPVTRYSVPIAGTDVTYEDLSMRYLYWPAAKVVKDDAASTVKGRDCWIVQIPNPNPKVGQYAWVRVWIDKENGAMWQIDGIDGRGELAKRFMIDSLMKLKDGSWFFKRMKVEVRDPSNPRKTVSVSYIDMENP
ncbi:outer membrane lipoprotein-sorting protein [Akkermansia sp.]|uniref:outer membrane lipoprotein-sorting protein n=1 Tax=Akkermansia sp. TaxID=1872421 RepID=UPI00266BD9D6|nr:outer membrane lipoprotein-sorting protein [uncultured Akkermansia sp.]